MPGIAMGISFRARPTAADLVLSAFTRLAGSARRWVDGARPRKRDTGTLPDYLLRDIGIKRFEAEFGIRRRPGRPQESR